MPSKSVSAVQRLTQTMRHYSGRTIMEKSRDAFGMNMRLKSKRSWPQREESFAAVQLMRQSRNWNNLRQFGTGDSHNMVSRRAPTIRRNNILSSKSAKSKRNAMMNASKKQKAEPVVEEMASGSLKEDDGGVEVEVRALRDVVFGVQDHNDDEYEKQRQADAELLKRIAKHRPVYPEASLSKKVIAPYSTYRTHRSSWAEFRHRMVYGGLSF